MQRGSPSGRRRGSVNARLCIRRNKTQVKINTQATFLYFSMFGTQAGHSFVCKPPSSFQLSDRHRGISIGIQASSVNSGCRHSAQQSAGPDLMSWDVCLSRWELESSELDLFWWRCNPPDCHPMPGPDWISRHGWGRECVCVCVRVCLWECMCSCLPICLYWCVFIPVRASPTECLCDFKRPVSENLTLSFFPAASSYLNWLFFHSFFLVSSS